MRRAVLVLLLAPLVAGCASLQDAFDARDPARPNVTFEAVLYETTEGAFTAILFADAAPETVAFHKARVQEGYYDGREFNRIIPGFVIQEVDRAGGATDHEGRVPLEAGTNVHFSRGAFGIARGAEPNSGGPEFFVMDFGHAHLHGNYTAFAQVVQGLEVVHRIARLDAVATGPVTGPMGQLPLPSLPGAVHDRVAVQPARITSASIVSVELPADVAAQFPRVVGPRTLMDDPPTRYTPEWPANLAVGNASALQWYVYTPPDQPMPDLASAKARVQTPTQDLEFIVAPDPADARILHWAWTPTERGAHTLMLEVGGKVVAMAPVTIA